MFRQITSLLSIRNVGYIRNPARKQKRLRDKILSESMKISPMTPMEKSRSDFKSKRNRFGVTIETNKVDHRQIGVDDRWKNLSKSDRKNPYKVRFDTTLTSRLSERTQVVRLSNFLEDILHPKI